MARKVFILQNEEGEILDVNSSLKRLVKSSSGEHELLSYRWLHKLSKRAREEGKNSITFENKAGDSYQISWWVV